MSAPMLTAERERELVARAQAGDAASEAGLLRAFEPLIRRRARRLPPNMREDAEQEARIGAIEAIRRFDAGRGLRLATVMKWWVHGQLTVHDELMAGPVSQSRKVRRENGAPERAELDNLDEPVSDDDPEHDAVETAMLEQLQTAVESLPERLARVVRLRCDGRSYDEVGRAVGGVGKCRAQQLHQRAMAELRRELAVDA